MNSLTSSQKATFKQAFLVLGLTALVLLLVMFLKERAWIILFMFGASLLWFGRKQLHQTAAVGSWPTTSACVVSTKIGEVYEGNNLTRYFPLVEFEYQLPIGTTHLTEAYSPAAADFASYERITIEMMLRPYSPGTLVEVLVSPQHPDIAYIRGDISPRQRSHILALIAGGLILSAISVLLGIWQYWM